MDRIPWRDVMAVGIRTTEDGPFAEDLFWQFVLRDRMIEIPGALVENDAFDVLRDHLPGIDWRKVVTAVGSTAERIFSLWDPDSPERADAGALRGRFAALVERLGGDAPASSEVVERLCAAWGGAARRYHDLGHLAACLHELDKARAEPAIADLVELALWYHDAVYEPGAGDCEQRSARLLEADAAVLALPAEAVRRAADLVLATAHGHGGAPVGDRATDLIVDIDLSILGRDVLSFMDFEYGVEEEYASTARFAFRVGRGRFLASLLASPHIFRTAYFRDRYERAARAQIGALLRSPRYRPYRWFHWLPVARKRS